MCIQYPLTYIVYKLLFNYYSYYIYMGNTIYLIPCNDVGNTINLIPYNYYIWVMQLILFTVIIISG